ncbi:hypothetical protein NQZ68_035167 [Dissostichus eleginoides]|nr:hypothetical protein NQZ68_035167 [Dissostichus eleginoides]
MNPHMKVDRDMMAGKGFSVPAMESMLENLSNSDIISICVQDPRLLKDYLWHTHVDYEICLHTNSMCFRKKSSCVRRRYSEFVWLRHCLEQNALIIELPKLPSWNPFFSSKNPGQVAQRMKGFEEFLESIFENPLLLSDSRLHLFLQSDLSITRIERCASGKTRYTVAEAIQRCISSSEDKAASCDSDCERVEMGGQCKSAGQPCKLKADERSEGSLKETAAVLTPPLPTAGLTRAGPTVNLACPLSLSSSLLPLDAIQLLRRKMSRPRSQLLFLPYSLFHAGRDEGSKTLKKDDFGYLEHIYPSLILD